MTGGRVSDVLRRIEDNIATADVVKTCFGILSILSREESNKQQIYKEGLDLVLNAMSVHLERRDVQEVGCELIWSLAFKNNAVKDMLAKLGGTLVIVRALKRHNRSADFLKNVCGALSNISQCRPNQVAIAAQGGLAPLVASVHVHIENVKILPFIFDAIAALIVSNEENGRTVSSLGLVSLIITSLNKYTLSNEVSKSGCHALAILTDVKGQATKISYAGGVSTMISLLSTHPSYPELHRVAFVVLLRMLQESSIVSRDIVQFDGVRVLLASLDMGGAKEDTVAAVAHILFTVTNPTSAYAHSIENQLWSNSAGSSSALDEGKVVVMRISKQPKASSVSVVSTLVGVIKALEVCKERKDVVKSCSRIFNNVLGFAGVAVALNGFGVFDLLLTCAGDFDDLKDLIDCISTISRQLTSRKVQPIFRSLCDKCAAGLVTYFRLKLLDEEAIDSCVEVTLSFLRELHIPSDASGEGKSKLIDDVQNQLFTVVCERSEKFRHTASAEHPLRKPQRYLSAILDLLEFLIKESPTISVGALREGSVLEDIVAAADRYSNLSKIIKTKVQSIRSKSKQTDGLMDDMNNPSTEIDMSDDLDEDISQSLPLKPLDRNKSVLVGPTKQSRELLDCSPSNLERFQSPTSVAVAATVRSIASSIERLYVVYECASAAGLGVMSKCLTEDFPYSTPAIDTAGPSPFSHSLVFDSEFESGNLGKAIQRDISVYDLFLRNDLHTPGHTQWYYFSVKNTHSPTLMQIAKDGLPVPPARIKFNIVNFTKPDSLFNMGMQPVLYSFQNASTKGIGWIRAGNDICYYANQYTRTNRTGEGDGCYYTLSFIVEFANANDTYLLAYTYPYTYSDYTYDTAKLLAAPGADAVIRKSILCKTLAGYDCDLITITNFREKRIEKLGPLTSAAASAPPKRIKGDNKQMKPCLFFSARVHPSEVQASWMMRGMLEFLVSSNPAAVLLREIFVIFIVPMLNVDGVVYGNTRCGLAGVDLNRMWRAPTPQHPTILALKTFMSCQRKHRDIALFIDLHGHSRKHNVFMYGCGTTRKTKSIATAFPKFLSMHKIGKKYVSYPDCSFHIKKSRESTARVVVCKEIGVARSYTLEATFSGPDFGELKNYHMHIGHFMEVGAGLCDSIAQFAQTTGFVKDFNLSFESVSVTVPRDVEVSAEEENDKDDFENDDMSSGSDDDAEEIDSADSAIKASDSLDDLIANHHAVGQKTKHSISHSIKKGSSARVDRPHRLPSPTIPQRRRESLRLIVTQNALLLSVGGKSNQVNARSLRTSSSGDSSQSGEDFMRNLDTTLLSRTNTTTRRVAK